jgi:hypothetical protein
MLALSFFQAPPDAAITSPDWYTTFDPATPRRARPVGVDARVTVAPGQAWTWELQVGVGRSRPSFTAVADGARTGPGAAGSAPCRPAPSPREVWERAMAVSAAKELPTAEQYALTLRLVVRLTASGVAASTGARCTCTTTRRWSRATRRAAGRARVPGRGREPAGARRPRRLGAAGDRVRDGGRRRPRARPARPGASCAAGR